jgi:hypothetical protein
MSREFFSQLTTKDASVLMTILERYDNQAGAFATLLREKLNHATVYFRDDIPGNLNLYHPRAERCRLSWGASRTCWTISAPIRRERSAALATAGPAMLPAPPTRSIVRISVEVLKEKTSGSATRK